MHFSFKLMVTTFHNVICLVPHFLIAFYPVRTTPQSPNLMIDARYVNYVRICPQLAFSVAQPMVRDSVVVLAELRLSEKRSAVL